ncbi:MAG TPA: glycosyltransferase family 39 protein [Bacteroidales bacterium]|nr:glycosyltransferase family 39 protein [Bacteroidales bacterium]
MLEGKALYVDLIDIKPPGIFWLYAFFQVIFGQSIPVMRLMTALFAAATAFMIFQFSRLMFGSHRAGVAGGMIYVLFVSTWSGYGISPNTELFFNFFTITGLFVLMKREHWLNDVGAGFIMGLGFIIKYLVLFDLVAFLLYFIILFLRHSPSWPGFGRLVVRNVLLLVGFGLPFALVNVYFYLTGHFGAFAEIVYFTMARYPREFRLIPAAENIGEFVLLFLPFLFFCFYVLFNRAVQDNRIKDFRILFLIWSVSVLTGIVLPGSGFNHYFIQLMVPVSLQAGLFFHPSNRLPRLMARFSRSVAGLLIVVITCLVIMAFSFRDHAGKTDTPRQIAAYLKPRLLTEDVIYAANHFHVLYFLLEKDSPTPYVHASLLTNPDHRRALNIDLERELQRIREKDPVYILIQFKGKNRTDWLNPFLEDHYFIEKQFNNRMQLYRRMD